MRGVDKPIAETSKSEIDKRLSNMGDYVKMSYLQRALNSRLDYDTRKFVLLRLSGIYEGRKMYSDAAKLVKNAAEINTTFKDKIRDFMRSVELHIKGGDFDEADRVFTQALALGNSKEKDVMKGQRKDFYLTQAKLYLSNDRRSHAKATYERLLRFDLDMGERNQVHKELLALYQRLGNIKEYYALKEKIEGK